MDSPLWVIMAPAGRHGGADGKHRSYLLIPCPDDRAEHPKATAGEDRVILLDYKSMRSLDGRMLRKGVATLPAGNMVARQERASLAGEGTGSGKFGDTAAKQTRSPPRRLAADRCSRDQRLTTRQIEILLALKDGASNKEIARNLGILESTVKVHLKSIYRQLRVRNRTQAAIVSAQYETARS